MDRSPLWREVVPDEVPDEPKPPLWSDSLPVVLLMIVVCLMLRCGLSSLVTGW